MVRMPEREIAEVIEWLTSLRNELEASTALVVERYPGWVMGVDARLTVLAKLGHSIRNAELTTVFTGCHLGDPAWWGELYPTAAQGDAKLIVEAFTTFSRFAFFHQMMADVESSLRIFLRALCPNDAALGRGHFGNVCAELFGRQLPELEPYRALMDVLREVRNTIHNNGLVFAPKVKSVHLEWGTESFDFVDGAPVDVATWPFLVARARDLSLLAVSVVLHPRISALPLIVDPAAPAFPA